MNALRVCNLKVTTPTFHQAQVSLTGLCLPPLLHLRMWLSMCGWRRNLKGRIERGGDFEP